MRVILIFFSLTGVLFLSACSNSGGSSASDPQHVMTYGEADMDCSHFRASLPADWQQGLLNVPENPDQPNGQMIQIFYYAKINPNSIPTVYFNGGPLSSSHGDYRALVSRQLLFDPDKKISMVFIDQRGNGCSQSYPQGKDPATLQRLSYYGSRGIVADAEAVRLKIWGNRPWIAAGQSYGGYIVHRYVTVHPESLTAAISQQDVLTTDGYFRLKTRIISQGRVLDNYFTEYPDDKARLLNLRSFLSLDKCFTNPSSTTNIKRACGYEILIPLTSFIGFTDQWLTIHQWLGIMVPASGVSEAGIQRFLKIYEFGSAANPANSKGWAGAVIDYVDRNLPFGFRCEQIRNDILPSGIDLKNVLLSECMVQLQNPPPPANNPAPWQQNLKQDPLLISDLASVLQITALPFYLYSGEKDTYVPVAEFAEELAAISKFPNVHYTDYLDSGHDGSYEEPQTWFDWQLVSTTR